MPLNPKPRYASGKKTTLLAQVLIVALLLQGLGGLGSRNTYVRASRHSVAATVKGTPGQLLST